MRLGDKAQARATRVIAVAGFALLSGCVSGISIDDKAARNALSTYLNAERAGDARGMYALVSSNARRNTSQDQLQALVEQSKSNGTALTDFVVDKGVFPVDGSSSVVKVSASVTHGRAGAKQFDAIVVDESGAWRVDTLRPKAKH